MSQHEHRTGRTAETRSTPSRGPAPVDRTELLDLQRTLGNAAVLHVLRRAGNPYAEEQPGAGPGRAPEQRPAVQRSAVHDVLSGSGRPLEAPLREEMEARLGADFGDVRVHDDADARASAAEVGARAYTSGHHVVIGDGGKDKHTLAHELTHVIQQRRGAVAGTDHGDGLRISDPSDAFEREAEANARRVMGRSVAGAAPAGHDAHGSAGTAHVGGTAVQRFMSPVADGDAAEWRQRALEYTSAHKARILNEYARVVLERDPDEKDMKQILKELEVLPAWLAVGKAARGGLDTVGPAVDASLTTLVQKLNLMEQECATAAKAGETRGEAVPLPGSVVGTEFTFTDSTLNGTVKKGAPPLIVDLGGLTGKAEANARSVITYAKGRMNAWTALVQKAAPPAGFTLSVSDTTVKDQDAKRFTYTNGSTSWWWEITMDDACLETRTDPTPISGLHASHVRAIIQGHIFALAEKCGLHVDQTSAGGGGHLSLDSASTFGGSVELFVQSMRQWETDWESWVDSFGAAPREKDVENAPWTGDLPQTRGDHLADVETLLDDILANARQGNVDLPEAVRQLQNHMAQLPLHAQASQRLRDKVASHPEDRSHYQAVNLEHMDSATEGNRRVEFRDIQAQSGYDQLLRDLGYIGRMLQDVRGEVAIDQRNRLDARHRR